MVRLVRSLLGVGLCFAPLAGLGCKPSEEIERYKVAREILDNKPVLPPNNPPPAPAEPETQQPDGKEPAPAASATDRMLAAIVPHGSQGWFFKLEGNKRAVSDQVEPFKDFVRSVHFDAGGQPQWKLPAGWTQEAASGLRFATIKLAGLKVPLEISVTTLGKPPGDDPAYNLINVNRWRGQMGLAPLRPQELAAKSEAIELADGAPAMMVDLLGVKKASGMGGPFSGAGNGK